ncbi:hypothetical protein OG871_36580 [Kitasatospora sp. NBC_00374]|uniref:hypothetical protein n=1 Tax=Kitasatospora sp. NBC_00374 TaxID=2975964 RepID=UPI0030E1465E
MPKSARILKAAAIAAVLLAVAAPTAVASGIGWDVPPAAAASAAGAAGDGIGWDVPPTGGVQGGDGIGWD